MTKVVNLELHRNTDALLDITVTRGEPPFSVEDITDCQSIILTVKDKLNGLALFTKEYLSTNAPENNTIWLQDPTNGLAQTTIDAADTVNFKNKVVSCVYDIAIVRVTGKRDILTEGNFTVMPTVS
jgi:hypothetical protein